MWPVEGHGSSTRDQGGSDADPDDEEEEVDLETQIAKEVAALKRPKVEKRFGRRFCFLLFFS
jgi:tRNA acetyltransferase TAN1